MYVDVSRGLARVGLFVIGIVFRRRAICLRWAGFGENGGDMLSRSTRPSSAQINSKPISLKRRRPQGYDGLREGLGHIHCLCDVPWTLHLSVLKYNKASMCLFMSLSCD